MGYLCVNIWSVRSLGNLDPETVVRDILSVECPNFDRVPGDQFEIQLREAEQNQSNDVILNSMRNKMAFSGPAIKFSFKEQDVLIEGLIKKHQIQFKYEGSIPSIVKARLEFLISKIVPDNIPYKIQYY